MTEERRRPPPPASHPDDRKRRRRPGAADGAASSSDRRRRRMHELESEAARRAYRGGNGSGGTCLPPLPTNYEDDGEDEGDGDGEGGGVGGGGGFRTLFGHPYGALPYGNIHLSPAGDAVRDAGLGPLLHLLGDGRLLEVLSYVDGASLGGGFARCSRYAYVLGHHEELWRDLALRRWGGTGIAVPPPPPPDPAHAADVGDEDGGGAADDDPSRCPGGGGGDRGRGRDDNGGCWKEIYAHNHRLSSASGDSAEGSPPPPRTAPPRHRPISVSGVHSDVLFRSWLCRSFALRPSWLSAHTVPALAREDVTVALFLSEYEGKNVPLLIRGASVDWGAVRKWAGAGYLRDVAAGATFRATSGAAPLPAKFAMGDYLNYCESATEEAPLYLFDRTFGTSCPELLGDFDRDLGRTCPWWDRDAGHGHDLFGLLGEGRRPDYQWLIVGPKRSGSAFHIDPNCTHAWNAPIIGRKRWIFYPPGVDPPGVYPSPDGDDVCMPISIGEWFLTHWDEHVRRRRDPDPRRRPMECTACPGDVLFVPHGWWHMVLNIGDRDDDHDGRGASVALTRNYVSASNLPDVLRFLDTRVGQISGCRDRRGEAIAPEDLGREFRMALMGAAASERAGEGNADNDEKKCCDERPVYETRRGKEGKWADLLEKSEARAKEGWGCDAWRDLPSPTPPSNDAGRALNGGIDATTAAENRRRGATTAGSSILARAKWPAFASDAGDTRAGGGGAVLSSSASGFSFSFL